MPGNYHVSIERIGFEASTPAQRRNALKGSFATMARLWHRQFKPLKFRRSAIRRYNLTPRRGEPGSGRRFEGSYAQAKVERRRLFDFSNEPLPIGENKPFVWSGRSRASALASRRVLAKATNSGKGHGTAVVRAPAFNRSGPRGRINLREEFVRVIPAELRHVGLQAHRHYDRRLARMTYRTFNVHRG